jgi:ribosome recycling factor
LNLGILQASVKDAAQNPEKAAEKTSDKVKKNGKKLENVTDIAAENVDESVGSAKEWIKNWQNEQAK